MYLIVIQVPFQPLSPDVVQVAADWGRSLQLLRDSFHGAFGPLVVASPTFPSDHDWTEQQPIRIDSKTEDILFVPLYEHRMRARQFWRRIPKIYKQCKRLAKSADIVHCGFSDLYRPLGQLGFRAALASRVPTVFVEDTDTVQQIRELSATKRPIRTAVYCFVYERWMRRAVAKADLSLLKGPSLHARYGAYAKNAKDFLDTSYNSSWIIPENDLAAKIEALRRSTSLRCVSLGRLVPRKGVDDTIRVIFALRRMDVPAELDIIGDGPARADLEALAGELCAPGVVRFLGSSLYSAELVASLRPYHLVLFTPLAEDTPRSLFDCLAAAVPLAAYDIDFVKALLASENCGISSPIGDDQGLALRVYSLWQEREMLVKLVTIAAAAAQRHSAEVWYARRASWTLEACQPCGSKKLKVIPSAGASPTPA